MGFGIFGVSWLITEIRIPRNYVPRFDDPGRDFKDFLTTYLDIAKFILTLSSGGIVLIVGSSALGHAESSCSAAFYPVQAAPGLQHYLASPLFLLAMSIFYGLMFMTLLTLNYESFKVGKGHVRWQYIRNRVFAFSGLACFCIGYAWLVYAATTS